MAARSAPSRESSMSISAAASSAPSPRVREVAAASAVVTLWRKCCAGFRHSAGFHARVVLLDGDAFRPGVLGELDDLLDDALGVLGVDRVVPIVVRVLCRGRRKSE